MMDRLCVGKCGVLDVIELRANCLEYLGSSHPWWQQGVGGGGVNACTRVKIKSFGMFWPSCPSSGHTLVIWLRWVEIVAPLMFDSL